MVMGIPKFPYSKTAHLSCDGFQQLQSRTEVPSSRAEVRTRCPNCGTGHSVKNGIVRGLQRYRCGICEYNFTREQRRGHSPATKCLAVITRCYGDRTNIAGV